MFRKENSPSQPIDYILGTNPYLNSPEQATELKKHLTGASDASGSVNGVELIAVKNVSPSFMLCTYLVKHDKQPLRFWFILYKPKDKWVLHRFKFDAQLDAELEEAGRIVSTK